MQGQSVGRKLVVSFAPLGIIVAALAIYLQSTIVTLGESQDLAINGLSRKVQLAGELDQLAERMRSDTRGLLLAAYSRNPADAQEVIATHRRAVMDFGKALAEAHSLSDGASEDGMLRRLRDDARKEAEAFDRYEPLVRFGKRDSRGKRSGSQLLTPLAEDEDQVTDQFKAEQVRDLHQASRQAKRAVAESRWVSFALLALCGCIQRGSLRDRAGDQWSQVRRVALSKSSELSSRQQNPPERAHWPASNTLKLRRCSRAKPFEPFSELDAISTCANAPMRLCAPARRNFASWPKTFGKSFG